MQCQIIRNLITVKLLKIRKFEKNAVIHLKLEEYHFTTG